MTGKPIEILPSPQGDGDCGIPELTRADTRGIKGAADMVVEGTPATPPSPDMTQADKKVIKLTLVPSDQTAKQQYEEDRTAAKQSVLGMARANLLALQTTIARLEADLGIRTIPEWLDLLLALEWAGDRTHYICPDPSCKQAREAGHLKECRLNGMITAQEFLRGIKLR